MPMKNLFARGARVSFIARLILVSLAFFLPLSVGVWISGWWAERSRPVAGEPVAPTSDLPLAGLTYWLVWLAVALAAGALLFALYQRVREREEDPLFAARAGLLGFVVLARLAWGIDRVQETVTLALFDESGISQMILLILTLGVSTVVIHH